MNHPIHDPGFTVMDPDPKRRVERAIEDIRSGRMVILVDDEDRENEGDLTMAAEKVTPEAINFMATYGRGLICLSLTESRVQDLSLPMMTTRNGSPYGTAFTVSIEARQGVSTGISAHDRAKTIQIACDPAYGPKDIVTPGHVFPLRARDAGVLVRTGQTEGSVDLARLAGLVPAGVICEIMNEDGSMARLPDLERFGATHRIRIVTVADLVRWRLRHETRVELVSRTPAMIPDIGDFEARIYRSSTEGSLHLALVHGEPAREGTLVRVQAACLAGDIFGITRCDCRSQLDLALRAIAREESGVLLYTQLAGERDPERTLERLRAHLRPVAPETSERESSPEPETREYGIGAQILLDLGIHSLRLLTNNPRKIVGLEGFGLYVTERVPIEAPPDEKNRLFLELQRELFGHLHRGI